MNNWSETLLSQYANSPTIVGLIESFNDAIDPATDIAALLEYVWDVDTAVGAGLDTLGAIVGVSRVLQVPYTVPAATFGFREAYDPLAESTGPQPFNQAPFSSLIATRSVEVDDDQYRLLILTKAMANISDRTAPALNKQLRYLFPLTGGHNVYVTDDGGMAMSIVFNFALTDIELAIVSSEDIIPRPSGVSLTIVQP